MGIAKLILFEVTDASIDGRSSVAMPRELGANNNGLQ